jgi:hypothetical protein
MLGANGNIAGVAIDLSAKQTDANLTLFLREPRKLKKIDSDRVEVRPPIPRASWAAPRPAPIMQRVVCH